MKMDEDTYEFWKGANEGGCKGSLTPVVQYGIPTAEKAQVTTVGPDGTNVPFFIPAFLSSRSQHPKLSIPAIWFPKSFSIKSASKRPLSKSLLLWWNIIPRTKVLWLLFFFWWYLSPVISSDNFALRQHVVNLHSITTFMVLPNQSKCLADKMWGCIYDYIMIPPMITSWPSFSVITRSEAAPEWKAQISNHDSIWLPHRNQTDPPLTILATVSLTRLVTRIKVPQTVSTRA